MTNCKPQISNKIKRQLFNLIHFNLTLKRSGISMKLSQN